MIMKYNEIPAKSMQESSPVRSKMQNVHFWFDCVSPDAYIICLDIFQQAMSMISGPVAQLVEHRPFKPRVEGSNPSGLTTYKILEEKDLAKLAKSFLFVLELYSPHYSPHSFGIVK